MYVPAHFQETNPATVQAFLRAHSFATLVTVDGAVPFASHLPLVFQEGPDKPGQLIGHLARANPQSQHLQGGREALAIFHGPHAYISPSYYTSSFMVPTWNYAAVHVYGVARPIENLSALERLLEATVQVYEAARRQPWQDNLPPTQKLAMMNAIVGFQIDITRIEAKFKLSQNRSREDVAGAVAALSQSENQTERELAALMKSQYEQTQQS